MSFRPLCDVWLLCRPKVQPSYYGAYPSGFLERARALLGVTINDGVLHVCGGRVRGYQSGPMVSKGFGPNDATIDLDPELEPDFLMDVRTLGVGEGDKFPVAGGEIIETGAAHDWEPGDADWWPACLIDRPYTEEDAEHYAAGPSVLPNINDLLRRALSITRPGGRVGVLDYVLPRPPRDGVKFVALVAVGTGYDQRARWFSVFERVCVNPLEYNIMTTTAPAQVEPEPEEVEESESELESEDDNSEDDAVLEPVVEAPVVHIDTQAVAKPKRKVKKKRGRLVMDEAPVKSKRKRPDITDFELQW